MAVNNRPTDQGAVAPPPSNDQYSPSGVFDREGVTLASQGGTSSSSIAESTLTPAGTGSGTGTAPNDTTITLQAGVGIDGGGSFTTNAEVPSTISFDLPSLIAAQTFGDANMPIASITVDAQGRVTNATIQGAAPIPTPFRDDFTTSMDTTPRAASMDARTETITLDVASGYSFDSVMATASDDSIPITIGDPVGTTTNMVTIPVTIPATQNPEDPVGPVRVETTSVVREMSTMRTREETATPLDTMTFIPFYQRSSATSYVPSDFTGFTASGVALTNGTMVTLSHSGAERTTVYGYLALEMEVGRTYRFDAGFFDIFSPPLSGTFQMFGRTFQFFEFPTRADLSFTIRW